MIGAGSPFLIDPEQYEQAVGVLDREALSPRDEALFQWLNRVTWAALVLSVFWATIVLLAPPAQLFILLVTSVCYLAVVPLFLMNGPLFWKLFTAARRERALQLTRPLGAIAAREPGARLRNIRNRVLVFFGVLALFWGLVGLSVWQQANLYGRLSAISFLFLGLACLLIYPVERARQRLRAMWLLRAAIDNATDGTIDEVYWDGIVCMERAQIIADLQSAVADTGSRPFPVLRMTDQFHDELNASDPEDATAIHAAIRELSLGDDSGETQGTRAIRGDLALKYVVDRQRNEIHLQEIIRTERRNNG